MAARWSVADGPPAKALLLARVITLTQGVLQSMVLTKVKHAVAVLLVIGFAALGAGGLLSRSLAIEPAGGMPDIQDKGQAAPDALRERVVELKQQLAHMQNKIAELEQETQPRVRRRQPM